MSFFSVKYGDDKLRTARHLSFAALLFTLSSGPAAARCEGAVVLGALHDAYHATLIDTGPTRITAAQTLLVLVGGKDATAFARQVSRSGITVPADRLADALRDAQQLAEATLKGERDGAADFRHSLNVDWLADTFLDTNCLNSSATASRDAVEPVLASERSFQVSREDEGQELSSLLYVAFALIVLSLLAYGALSFHKSVFMRRKRVERLPRTSVDLSLEVTFTDDEGEMAQTMVKVIDISAGGMKVAWQGAPPAGTTATFQLLSSNRLAQIAWANNFYAGVMFETMLNKQELSTLISANPA